MLPARRGLHSDLIRDDAISADSRGKGEQGTGDPADVKVGAARLWVFLSRRRRVGGCRVLSLSALRTDLWKWLRPLRASLQPDPCFTAQGTGPGRGGRHRQPPRWGAQRCPACSAEGAPPWASTPLPRPQQHRSGRPCEPHPKLIPSRHLFEEDLAKGGVWEPACCPPRLWTHSLRGTEKCVLHSPCVPGPVPGSGGHPVHPKG